MSSVGYIVSAFVEVRLTVRSANVPFVDDMIFTVFLMSTAVVERCWVRSVLVIVASLAYMSANSFPLILWREETW